jgi:REP element-mobilizing transposase RayT
MIFRDDTDRKCYLRLLGQAVERYRWRCLGYCLMGNHIHLVIETPEGNLSEGMQWLHGMYAAEFNKRHNRVGHLFQGRYGATRITSDAHLWIVLTYVAANPVEANLVERPEAWPWNSYAVVVGPDRAPSWLDVERLDQYLNGDDRNARKRYANLVVGADSLARTFRL